MLQYILPPLLGAAIGYVTNYIAIRMLFRPLKELRIFGVRVPFTPGVIPRQRYQLAESIGRMVSQQLLTEETVREHIRGGQFREGLRRGIEHATEDLLSRRVRLEPNSRLSGLIEELVSGLLSRFLRSQGFHDAIHSMIERLLRRAEEKRLGEILGDEELLQERIRTGVDRVITQERVHAVVVETGERFVARHVQENTPLRRVLTDEIMGEIARFLMGIYDSALDHLVSWLRRPDIRSELNTRGTFILRDILDKLNVWQRFFVTAAQYDRQLSDRMPEIVDDLIQRLDDAGREPQNKERVIRGILDGLRKWQDRGLADIQYTVNVDLQAQSRRVLERIAASLNSDSVRQTVSGKVQQWVEAHREQSIGEIAGNLLSLETDELIAWSQRRAAEWLEREDVIERIQEEAVALVRRSLTGSTESSLGEMLAVQQGQKTEVTELVAENVEDFVDRKLPDIVHTLDIKTLVVNRVNSLDVAEVERLLLTVIAKHLKWINVFGALLGAIIGGVQIIGSFFWLG